MQRKSPAENDDPVNRETRTCQSASSIPSEKAELRLTLYEIEAGLAEVCERILDSQEEGKEPDETDFLVLQEYLKGAATKRDNVARIMLHLEAMEQLAAAEEKRLSRRRLRLAATRKRLQSYVLLTMARHGYQKLEGELLTLKLHKNPPSVEMTDELLIPAEFVIEKPPPLQVDKKLLLNALMSGRSIPGARLVANRYRLKIE